tara:strand:+ start:118 stop:264 length:147 start_codon:yes stop_codon:yes gene_type:complete
MKHDIQTLENIHELLTKENSNNVKHLIMPLLKFVIWNLKEKIEEMKDE